MRVLCGWTLKAKNRGKVRRKQAGIGDNSAKSGYLDGQLLIAMPVMGDPRFERSVIYMCAHSSEGAMGIMVNRPAGSIDFPELLVQLNIINKADQIKLPENAETMKVLKRRSGRYRPRLRAAFQRLLSRERHAADRRPDLPDRDRRYPQGDRQGQGAQARHPRARLCRLGGRASSRTKSRAMAGCIATPIPIWCSATTSRTNTRAPCARSASIPACCRTTRGTRSSIVMPGLTRLPAAASARRRPDHLLRCAMDARSSPRMTSALLRRLLRQLCSAAPARTVGMCPPPWRGACRAAATGRSGGRGAWSGGCPTSRGHAASICGRRRIPASSRAR